MKKNHGWVQTAAEAIAELGPVCPVCSAKFGYDVPHLAGIHDDQDDDEGTTP